MRKSTALIVPALALTLSLSAAGMGAGSDLSSEHSSGLSAPALSQDKTLTVSGLVTDDATGEPLPGVVIMISGDPTRGTVTDAQGRYTLPGVDPKDVLIFSLIGMKTEEIKVEGRSVINVRMKEDSEILDEVVVTGYQTVKKERMTGSVASISAGDIKNLNIKSVDQVLIGTVSGLSAVATGRPGADLDISIRGANTLTGNNQPVWIVDGMPINTETPAVGGQDLLQVVSMTGIGNIAPDDIESITVLKDAAATAIYGARAANGVIVVTTKKGAEGNRQYNLSLQFGLTERPRSNVRMMNSTEKVLFETQLYNDLSYENVGRAGMLLQGLQTGKYTAAQAEAELARLRSVNTDWFKELYKPAFSTQIHGTISGGTNKTQYYTSLNYLRENGTELNNAYQRARLSTKINHDFGYGLSLYTELAGTYRTDRTSASSISPLQYAVYANPYETPDAPDLSWDMTPNLFREGLAWETLNVKQDMMDNTSNSRYTEIALNSKLEWKPAFLEGLSLASQIYLVGSGTTTITEELPGTYTNYQKNWLRYTGAYRQLLPEQIQGSLNESGYTSDGLTWRNTASYDLNLGDAHIFNFFLGQEITAITNYSQQNYSPVYNAEYRIVGYPQLPDDLPMNRIPWQMLGGTRKDETRMSSFFFNGSYSYRDRYVLSGSVRYDGSNIIGNQNQFTPLWNVSARWNLHEESFFNKKNGILDFFSLRSGFGYTGSIDKNALPFVTLELNNLLIYDGQNIPTSYVDANPNVRWQTKQDFNVGFESAWFDNRLNLNVNYYHNFIYDLLDQRTLPLSSGRDFVRENVANLINDGWEFDLGAVLVRGNNFYWDVKANLALNSNEITKTFYSSIDELPIASSGAGAFLVQGYAVGDQFGYEFAGIDPATGHTLILDDEGNPLDMESTGDDGSGLPNPRFLGHAIAPYVGGFSTNLMVRNFSLGVSFEYKGGNIIPSFNSFQSLNTRNRHISDQNRWRAPGDMAAKPAITLEQSKFSRYALSNTFEKGDYLRLTYLTLGYNLPSRLLKSWRLTGLRFTLSANNLFTLTNYKGIDPASGGAFTYPNTRRYNLSINLNF